LRVIKKKKKPPPLIGWFGGWGVGRRAAGSGERGEGRGERENEALRVSVPSSG